MICEYMINDGMTNKKEIIRIIYDQRTKTNNIKLFQFPKN